MTFGRPKPYTRPPFLFGFLCAFVTAVACCALAIWSGAVMFSFIAGAYFGRLYTPPLREDPWR